MAVKPLTDIDERERVRQETEQNRKAVPANVVRALAAMSVTLDDVLDMSRQQFEAVDDRLYERKISDDDRRPFIRFKHHSMTHAESRAYFEPTAEEWEEIDKEEP